MKKQNIDSSNVKLLSLLAVMGAAFGILNGVANAAATVFFENNQNLAGMGLFGSAIVLLIMCLILIRTVGTLGDLVK